MKRSLSSIIALTVLTAFIMLGTASAADLIDVQSLITVGSGFVVVPADVAIVSLAIESTAKESGTAHQNNTQIIQQIMQALKAENLPGLAFTERQVMFWENTGLGSRDKTFKASSGLDVQVRDLNAVGHIIDVATKNGATSVQNVRFDVSNIDAAAKKALELAVSDAIQKANVMASAAGLRVAMVRQVQDNNAVRVYNPSLPPATSSSNDTVELPKLPALAGPVYRGQVLVQTEVSIIFDVALDKTKTVLGN